MYLRIVRHSRKDGTEVRYLSLAESVWDRERQRPRVRTVHNFSREDRLDPQVIQRLVDSLSNWLANQPAADDEVAARWARLGLGEALARLLQQREFDPALAARIQVMVTARSLGEERPEDPLALEALRQVGEALEQQVLEQHPGPLFVGSVGSAKLAVSGEGVLVRVWVGTQPSFPRRVLRLEEDLVEKGRVGWLRVRLDDRRQREMVAALREDLSTLEALPSERAVEAKARLREDPWFERWLTPQGRLDPAKLATAGERLVYCRDTSWHEREIRAGDQAFQRVREAYLRLPQEPPARPLYQTLEERQRVGRLLNWLAVLVG